MPRTSLGLGLGLSFVKSALAQAIDVILSLFTNGEQGVYYDIQDLNTLFQDAAGTTPAVVNQPVGLVLDKRKGLVQGPELSPGGGTFDSSTGWTLDTGWAIGGGVASFPVSDALNRIIRANNTLVAGKTYILSVQVTRLTGNYQIQAGNTSSGSKSTSGTITAILKSDLTNFTFTALAGFTGSIDNFSVKELSGNHASQNTTASKPILKQDGTTGSYYLQFDGFDDFLSTAAIDFTATDAVTIFAGVRKLSDATVGVVCEYNTTSANNQMFGLYTPVNAAAANVGVISRGTAVASAAAAGYASPISLVATAYTDISSDIAALRVNGVVVGSSIADQGTGNYGTNTVYIGRRAGTSLPVSAQLYSLTIRGTTTDSTTIAAVETQINSYTGAY